MVRAIALLLTVLTGFSGLVYEVAWQKAFAILLGSHSEATAAVLGIFLGGLALGYALFGRVTTGVLDRAAATGTAPRLLGLYGLVEAGIGIWALAFPWLFEAARALSLWVPLSHQALGFGADVVLTALLLGPPTVLMGGTIPILTQALARSLGDATRFHAFVYGFNTAGAFAGAVAATFVLIPLLGIHATIRWMGVVNLFAGGSFLLLGALRRTAVPAPSGETAARVEGFAAYASVALLLGFAMMAIQTVLIRVGGLSFGASQFTFGMIVAVTVLCIALGSLGVTAFERIPRPTILVVAWALTGLIFLLYTQLDSAPYYAYVLRTVFRDQDSTLYAYFIAAFLVIGLILFVPLGLSGSLLPLLFHQLRREVGQLGHMAGRLYAWNTLGSLLGALLGGYALLIWLDLHHVYRLAVAALGVAAAILTTRVYRGSTPVAMAAVVAVIGGLMLAPAWDQKRLSAGLFRKRVPEAFTYRGPSAFFRHHAPRVKLLFYEDDPTASISVNEPPSGTRVIVNNGKPDGSLLADYQTMAMLALVPCLVADGCEDVFVVGYGTGVSAGELAALRSTRRVVVAEISRGVLDAAPYFESGNLGASQNPKVQIDRGDAYRTLLRSEGTYDVILSEPSNPWVAGVEMLYSREFLTAASERLRPGGVFAQWFHLYETDRASVELVLRTYLSVFDSVAVWHMQANDLLLLGFPKDPGTLDLDRIAARMNEPDFRAGLRRSGIDSLPALLAHEAVPLGVLRKADLQGEVHTLGNPRLSALAVRAFVRGDRATLPSTAALEPARIGARASLLGAYLTRSDVDPQWRSEVAEQVCLRPECTTLIAHWLHEDPESAELAALRARKGRDAMFNALTQPLRLQQLVALYGGNLPGDGSVTPKQAELYATLFNDYYLHGLPFSREALRGIQARCRVPECAAIRSRTEEQLGSLRTPLEPARR